MVYKVFFVCLFVFLRFSDRFLKGIISPKVSSSLVMRFGVPCVRNKIHRSGNVNTVPSPLLFLRPLKCGEKQMLIFQNVKLSNGEFLMRVSLEKEVETLSKSEMASIALPGNTKFVQVTTWSRALSSLLLLNRLDGLALVAKMFPYALDPQQYRTTQFTLACNKRSLRFPTLCLPGLRVQPHQLPPLTQLAY